MDRAEQVRRIEVLSDEEAAALRRIPGSRRVAMLDELCEFGRNLMLARLCEVHPEWTDEERSREVARRIARASE